ncbi:MAG: alpha/beta fold hydrolase [Deltaproteobacteria bacterium]|nr:alpha/beta fold hydrolase [Deltaproteobacteria bacterium]
MNGMLDRLLALSRAGGPDARYYARTRDGWNIALYRYTPRRGAHATPVLLCHGMGSNRFNMDGPGTTSLARALHAAGYDVWLIELRGAGRSQRRLGPTGLFYQWTFEDYVQHDAPAALRVVRRVTGWRRVLWVGHSLGGMVAYGLLMTPAADGVAGAVTLGSPGMTGVGHLGLDRWVALRKLLRYAPPRIPTGTLAMLGAPVAGPVAAAIAGPLRDWGWTDDNFDLETARFMMRYGVEDLSRSLLREFARWYAAKRMSDRYDLFSFTDHLERVRVPMLVIAGSHDGLTPAHDIAHVAERLGSADKTFLVAGKQTGFAHDYSHVDLVLGTHAHEDIFPRIREWLDTHRSDEDAPHRGARRASARADRAARSPRGDERPAGARTH